MTLTLTPETPDTEEDILAALRASEDDFADGRWVSLEDLEARLQIASESQRMKDSLEESHLSGMEGSPL